MDKLILKIKSLVPKLGGVNFSYEKVAINPEKDWKIILFIAQLLIVIGIGVAAYFYIQVENNSLFTNDIDRSEGEVKINRVLFDKIVRDAKDRAENFEKIRNSKAPSDPSL